MAENRPPSKRKNQGQFVARQAGPVAVRTDPGYPKDAFHGVMMSQESLSGPLPSPKLVAGYAEVIHNGAERIMVMAEKEQEGRLQENRTIQQINKMAVRGHNFRGAFGQISALALVIGMLWLGFRFATDGKEELAKELFRYTITGVVAVFLGGQAGKVITMLKGPKESDASEQGAE